MNEFILFLTIITRAEFNMDYTDLLADLLQIPVTQAQDLSLGVVLDISRHFGFPMNVFHFNLDNELILENFQNFVNRRQFNLTQAFWPFLQELRREGFSLEISQNPAREHRLNTVNNIVYPGVIH